MSWFTNTGSDRIHPADKACARHSLRALAKEPKPWRWTKIRDDFARSIADSSCGPTGRLPSPTTAYSYWILQRLARWEQIAAADEAAGGSGVAS